MLPRASNYCMWALLRTQPCLSLAQALWARMLEALPGFHSLQPWVSLGSYEQTGREPARGARPNWGAQGSDVGNSSEGQIGCCHHLGPLLWP